MFEAVYPEHKWDLYKFSKIPQGHVKQLLENPSEQKKFVKYLEQKFNVTRTSDWYLITSKQLKEVVSIDLKTLMNIIKNIYPDMDIKNVNYKLKNTDVTKTCTTS